MDVPGQPPVVVQSTRGGPRTPLCNHPDGATVRSAAQQGAFRVDRRSDGGLPRTRD